MASTMLASPAARYAWMAAVPDYTKVFINSSKSPKKIINKCNTPSSISSEFRALDPTSFRQSASFSLAAAR